MKRVSLFIIACVCMLALVSCATAGSGSKSGVVIRFFDGVTENWGDATFITFPNGENMLIDAGMASVGPQIGKALRELGVTRIDHLVISHFHSDHVGGLSYIYSSFEIGHVYSNGYYTTDTGWAHSGAKTYAQQYTILHKGDSFDVGEVHFDILWPTAEYTAVLPENSSSVDTGHKGSTVDMNNSSLLIKMTYGENTVLFTGDLYLEGQQSILATYADDLSVLDCDIMKVPHHGYDNANNGDFIRAVSPTYAFQMGTMVMSGGLFFNYLSVNCFPYMSWQNGAATVSLDGTDAGIVVEVENPERNAYFLKYYEAYQKKLGLQSN